MPKAQRKRTSKSKSDLAPTSNATISKSTKKKQRHSAWLEKLDHSYTVKKKQQQKKSRQTMLQKGGFDEFDEVLQMIDTSAQEGDVPNAEAPANSAATSTSGTHLVSLDKIKSKKRKQNTMLQDMARFQKVLQHDAFKNDPLSTIRQHVQNTFK
ncbi:ribosome biogenesis protein SLX9-domain-containing protein [Gongronella butleri]|nr:ribosome biogenesis protein SLX9-domain-containing protein [Gongronella butleri]